MRLKPIVSLAAAAVLVLGSPLAARADANYDLIEAAFNGNPAAVASLVKRGADVNGRDDYGYTPLMWAAQQGHVLTCEALIKRGADVNARDKQGRTALLIATVKGHIEVVKALMAHHADPQLKANNGISAADYARIYRMTAIQQVFGGAAAQHPATAQQHPTTTPRPVASHRPMLVATPRPMPTTHAAIPTPRAVVPTPRPVETVRPTFTPRPAAATAAPVSTSGNANLSPQTRDEIGKLHGRFMDHLGLRDPEMIVQKGFNQDLEDKLDQVFLALDYGHTAQMSRAKLADARKLVNAAKQVAAQPDPQDDKTCRQILSSLDELLKGLGS